MQIEQIIQQNDQLMAKCQEKKEKNKQLKQNR